MTALEKFALAKALHDARLVDYGPAVKPYVAHQFNLCVGAIIDVVCKTREEFHQFRALVDRDNWIERDNPFRD